ncbi:MAG: hypothetical protein PHP62_01460 [Candidatus Moranbacteria bacterium]|nr:hypothetical protein [Candidatus Moranbacteria bacterium]
MKILGVRCYGIFDTEQDSTPRVFKGRWRGRHCALFATPMAICMSVTLTGMAISGTGTTTGLTMISIPTTLLRFAQLSLFLSFRFCWRVLFCE